MSEPTIRKRLIEMEGFPFETVSRLAERESWRKEIYRPVYHVHKWWAKRLGSVFRGAILGCLLDEGEDLMAAFYEGRDDCSTVVFDPFMGSGTTVGEAHKLGCVALGRDINPVAAEAVRVAFTKLDSRELQLAMRRLGASVGERIRGLYQEPDGSEVLYFFWVKYLPCPECGDPTDLLNSRIVAKNAYPKKKPEIQVLCPGCGEIFASLNTCEFASCPACSQAFSPQSGNVTGSKAKCKSGHVFGILNEVKKLDAPPPQRIFGKLVLTPDGGKEYRKAVARDRELFAECETQLAVEVETGAIRLPSGVLTDGFNTRQAMGYNYREWLQFFNSRQLLALGWLHEEICKLPKPETRDALLTLFSGLLEFNNVFASYKGEGTGAVRHMFSHHILKPERLPIEANVWGTSKSSGSFSNLFQGRIMRASAYQLAPFEVCADSGKRSVGKPFSGKVITEFPPSGHFEPRGIYLSCGSSDKTGLPDRSVDYVVTDPPFFDNVHYSELADFFYSWQKLESRGFLSRSATTRQKAEVQDTDAAAFSEKLGAVFIECHRILKPGGLLVFSYHHSRTDGWSSVACAIAAAGFSVVASQPVKAELSLATPKAQAKEPIQVDVLMVCRRQEDDARSTFSAKVATATALAAAERKCSRLRGSGFKLSVNDRRVVFFSEFLACVGKFQCPDKMLELLEEASPALEAALISGTVARVVE